MSVLCQGFFHDQGHEREKELIVYGAWCMAYWTSCEDGDEKKELF